MASSLVPTVLNLTGDHTTVPPWTEPCSRLHNASSGSTHSSVLPGIQGATSEQSTREVLLMEEPDDDGELKLPKMRSLIIMICTNVLLQVRRLWRCTTTISLSDDH